MQGTFHTLLATIAMILQSGIINCFPSEETETGNSKTRILRQGDSEKHPVISLLIMSLSYSPFFFSEW